MKVIILRLGISLNTVTTRFKLTITTFDFLLDNLVVSGTAYGAIGRHRFLWENEWETDYIMKIFLYNMYIKIHSIFFKYIRNESKKSLTKKKNND